MRTWALVVLSGLVGCGSGGSNPAIPDAATTQGWWRPTPGTSWQIQFSGTIDESLDVEAYDVDLFDTPEYVMDALHPRGVRVICYFSAGSHEDWRDDAADFPAEVLGDPLDGWPGERWLDVRAASVRDVMRARLDFAVTRGCDAVDPDNVDGFANPSGFPLTGDDQLDYNRFLADEAHARGLAIGLKNDVGQIDALVDDFEFQINEECFDYDECDTLAPFVDAGKPVFQLQYGDPGLADTICPDANARDFDTLIKNLELDAPRTPCR